MSMTMTHSGFSQRVSIENSSIMVPCQIQSNIAGLSISEITHNGKIIMPNSYVEGAEWIDVKGAESFSILGQSAIPNPDLKVMALYSLDCKDIIAMEEFSSETDVLVSNQPIVAPWMKIVAVNKSDVPAWATIAIHMRGGSE